MADDKELFFDEDGIDPERIVQDEHQVAPEFYCAICQGLLWKPRACASCQHLFCHRCIRSWLQIHPTSCPFRCSPYEEKRAPPYIHSLLDRVTVRSRNNAFGCSEVLSYGRVEQHQAFECHFPTRKCHVCENYVLISELGQHQASCISTSLKCSLCQCLVDRALFAEHTAECFEARVNQIVHQIIPQELPVAPAQEHNEEHWFIRFNDRLQRFLSVMPRAELDGFEAVVQARQRSVWLQLWTLFQLIILNVSRAPQIIILLLSGGVGVGVGVLIALAIRIQEQVECSPYRSFAAMILCSGLLSFGLPALLTLFSDTWIILCLVMSSLLCGSLMPEFPVDYFRIHMSGALILIACPIILVVYKLWLLGVRFYFCYLPPYISASVLAWTLIFCTFQMRRY